MSSIQDMNNRIKQNRSQRPSKRAKFKENNRETIYAGTNQERKASFKEFSDFQVKSAIRKIRAQAKTRKKKEHIFLGIFISIVTAFIFYSLTIPKAPQSQIQSNNKNKPNPIIWNGSRSEPIKIPHSEFFYIPIVGELNNETHLNRTYEIEPANLAVKYTSNIIFFDKDCVETGKLLPQNGAIKMMFVGPGWKEFERNKIVYVLAKNDTNGDGKINHADLHLLYISELDGKELVKITDRSVIAIGWVEKGDEIFMEFESTGNKNDSIYGLFNIKSKRLKLTNESRF